MNQIVLITLMVFLIFALVAIAAIYLFLRNKKAKNNSTSNLITNATFEIDYKTSFIRIYRKKTLKDHEYFLTFNEFENEYLFSEENKNLISSILNEKNKSAINSVIGNEIISLNYINKYLNKERMNEKNKLVHFEFLSYDPKQGTLKGNMVEFNSSHDLSWIFKKTKERKTPLEALSSIERLYAKEQPANSVIVLLSFKESFEATKSKYDFTNKFLDIINDKISKAKNIHSFFTTNNDFFFVFNNVSKFENNSSPQEITTSLIKTIKSFINEEYKKMTGIPTLDIFECYSEIVDTKQQNSSKVAYTSLMVKKLQILDFEELLKKDSIETLILDITKSSKTLKQQLQLELNEIKTISGQVFTDVLSNVNTLYKYDILSIMPYFANDFYKWVINFINKNLKFIAGKKYYFTIQYNSFSKITDILNELNPEIGINIVFENDSKFNSLFIEHFANKQNINREYYFTISRPSKFIDVLLKEVKPNSIIFDKEFLINSKNNMKYEIFKDNITSTVEDYGGRSYKISNL